MISHSKIHLAVCGMFQHSICQQHFANLYELQHEHLHTASMMNISSGKQRLANLYELQHEHQHMQVGWTLALVSNTFPISMNISMNTCLWKYDKH